MKKDSQNTDPSRLLRYSYSIYASDLLICAVACLDFFTFLSKGSKTFDEICDKMEIQPRPADVLVSLLLSMELIKANAHRYGLAELSAKYLVNDSPDSLVPYYYYYYLKNRPKCLEFHDVLKTGMPAGWSSKDIGNSWTKSMQSQGFADTFTAAMDSRCSFLGRKLAEAIDVIQHNALLDIAGGSGIYACSIANRNSPLGTRDHEKLKTAANQNTQSALPTLATS